MELIEKQTAINALQKCRKHCIDPFDSYHIDIQDAEYQLYKLPTVQIDNKVNLCDSCVYTYPDCAATINDVIFGNDIGNKNICACKYYLTNVRKGRDTAKWFISSDGYYPYCSACLNEPDNGEMSERCPNCGRLMINIYKRN